MIRFATIAALASLALAGAAASASAHAVEEGKERWVVKTTAPRDGSAAVLPLSSLLSYPVPAGVGHNDARYQSARILGSSEGAEVTTTGWLHLVAFEDDGDFHVQISASPTDGSPCLIVEIPNPEFIADPELKAQATAARAWLVANVFAGRAPAEGGSIVRHPVKVTVTGALFFDDSHVGTPPRGKKGMKAGTLWELHPVTAIGPAS